jgi:predicted chitinase
MKLRRVLGAVTAVLAASATMVIVGPSTSAEPVTIQAACAAPWNASQIYTGGMVASHVGHNWGAKWWTQGEVPGTTGQWGVWADQGVCGGTNPPPPPPPPPPGGFVVSQAQFNQMFPSRNPFYTYQGLTTAMGSFSAFARTGSDTVRRQEAAAFLANVSHETGGLVHITEIARGTYCDTSRPYGCPAGAQNYYGRGPIQLSWNFNYFTAGNALGLPLLNNPWLVEQDAAVAWKTGLWYWMTQNGPGTMTGHNAMVNSRGFGETIRSINGSLECGGRNPAQVQSRINNYQRFTQILGVTPGGNLSC